MHSLEAELAELQAVGAIGGLRAEGAMAWERRAILSVFGELRGALYAAVALIVTGVGILVDKHLDQIGPLTLTGALCLSAAACYAPAIRAQVRGTDRSVAADYLLLLGALLASVDLGYAESQFHWLGAHWSRHLLILTIFHAFAAYVFNSRLLLSVALTSLAGWFEIEPGPGGIASWGLIAPALGLRALLCAAVMLAWRAIDQRANAALFREVFDHFVANLAFWAVLSWCSDPHLRVAGVTALLILAGITVRSALRSGAELFAVYGIGYGTLGICIVLSHFIRWSSLAGAIAVLAVVLTAAALLRYIHDRLRVAP